MQWSNNIMDVRRRSCTPGRINPKCRPSTTMIRFLTIIIRMRRDNRDRKGSTVMGWTDFLVPRPTTRRRNLYRGNSISSTSRNKGRERTRIEDNNRKWRESRLCLTEMLSMMIWRNLGWLLMMKGFCLRLRRAPLIACMPPHPCTCHLTHKLWKCRPSIFERSEEKIWRNRRAPSKSMM